jgi:GNAT superfamily N-acetyltransferase
MDDPPVEFSRSEFVVSTDRSLIDPDRALALLHTTFWAATMDRSVLVRAMANSICFGLHKGDSLIGFGRVVTDLGTYAYWTDVVVADEYRGRGLGRWLSDCMLAHPGLQGLRRVALLTRDAAALYAGVGFSEGPGALIYMERRPS